MNDDNTRVGLLISDLPDALLVHVAKYLAKPSVSIFAVAIAGPSSNVWQPSETINAIISAASYWWGSMRRATTNQWQELDFGDCEGNLSSKLTDDDMHSILICIGAIYNLKILKLIGCTNITGSGLEPITGSMVLEWIASNSDKDVPPAESNISDDVLISILERIIESPDSKLQVIFFPGMSIDNNNAFVNRHQSLRMCFTDESDECSAILSSRLPQNREGARPTCPYCKNRYIELVMRQAGSSRANATSSLELHRWDLVRSIMQSLNHM